jgi:large subunit ribosomal protein L1
MSKTSQDNKAKKAALAQEDQVKLDRKAEVEVEQTPAEVLPKVKKVSVKDGSTSGGKKVKKAAKSVEEKVEVADAAETVEETETVEAVKVKVVRVRGKKYQAARKKIDVNKLYSLTDAVKLVKETSISKFDGKVEAHVTVLEIGTAGEIVFPHLETSSKRIVVLNDVILAEIKDGKVNFDILIATPVTMPKLLPFARVLGPKGLMPNPKSGTLTDKPEEAVKKLSVAKTVIKTEKKAPVVHIVVGKVSQNAKELEANVNELVKVIKAAKIKKLALCATMGPSVKVEILK